MKMKNQGKSTYLLEEIEFEFAPYTKWLENNTTQIIKEIVQVADIIEAISFLQDEGVGANTINIKNLLKDTLCMKLGD